MKRVFRFLPVLLLLVSGIAAGQTDPVIEKIKELSATDNRVMELADVLTNRFGDRVTGSDGYYNASMWALNEMRSWGMKAELEEAGELPVGFNRGPFSGEMVYPRTMALHFSTPAYTSGTKGKQKGHVTIAPVSEEDFNSRKESFKNSWVLIPGINDGWPRDRGGVSKLTELITGAGALGTIQESQLPIRVLYARVGSWEELPNLPDIKLSSEQYKEIEKIVKEDGKVELEIDIRNYFRPGPVKYHNVIGWIPGTDLSNEYVVMSGHLDGLSGGTGAVDNASGATPAMEAARLIMAAGGKPRRTVMVHLYAAEEFGLLGSKSWVKNNPEKLAGISALFNRDGGTNCISGLAVPKAMMEDFKVVTKPIMNLHPKYPFELTERTRPIRKGGRGGTDTWPFLQEDVPAFGFATKGEQKYFTTWHTELDTYDQLIPEYQEYSTMVTAIIVYGIANLDHKLSRDGFFMDEGIYADITTNKGRISLMLDYKNAPMTVANFIGLAEGTITNATYDKGVPFYKGSPWHRVVKGHVIQGGAPLKNPEDPDDKPATGYTFPNEINGLSHDKAGMVGMANAGPHTNTSQFYITLANRSYLDGNYTLFGWVVDGMDIVNNIEQGDTIRDISIVRAGAEAGKFVVNDDTFKQLVDNQWKIVRAKEKAKTEADEKYISANWPALTALPSGLRYTILKQGKGAEAATGSQVTFSYKGFLTNGTQFVSGSEGGKPSFGKKPSEYTHRLRR